MLSGIVRLFQPNIIGLPFLRTTTLRLRMILITSCFKRIALVFAWTVVHSRCDVDCPVCDSAASATIIITSLF